MKTKKTRKTKKTPAKRKPAAKRNRKKATSKRRSSTRIEATPGQVKAFRSLQGRLEETWHHLQHSVKTKNQSAVLKHRNELLLLLGECDYLVNEYSRCLRKN